MRGNVVFSSLKPTVDLYLYSHTSCTPLPARAGVVSPQLMAARKTAAWPPGYPQPLEDLSWYQDLSPHIPVPCSLQESPSVLPPHPFPPCGASCGILLQDSKAPLLGTHSLATSPSHLGFLVLCFQRTVEPLGTTFFLHPGQCAIRNLYRECPRGLQDTGPPS